MSEKKASIEPSFLYGVLMRELESNQLQEIDPDLYSNVADFVINLKSQGFDGLSQKLKDSLVDLVTNMVSLLLKTRIEKVANSNELDYSNLVDIERYIVDSEDEKRTRREHVLNAVLNGRLKFLDRVAQRHKSRLAVVRFLKPYDQIIGSDMKKYGPFEAEDVGTIPFENARALISKEVASIIKWED